MNEDSPTAAAEATLNRHLEARGLDDEGNPKIALWHLLLDMRQFARSKGVDMEEVYQSVLEEYATVVGTENPVGIESVTQ